MRCHIHLMLCHNKLALDDAKNALKGLCPTDPTYSKALGLQGDALYQMGKFEHALVIYHRGNRLIYVSFTYYLSFSRILIKKILFFRLKGNTDDEFRLGIQKATESINNCLKNIRKKVKYR